MNLFYTPDINSEKYTLTEVESRHCVKVLRMKNGQDISLVDGKGNFYIAEIIDAHHKHCTIEIRSKTMEYGKRKNKLHVAIAPTKNIDRFEWFLEKATEIGIDEITPILCENSERKVIKPERLEKVIVSAMKQSLKAYKPSLNRLTDFPELLNSGKIDNGYIAHCGIQERKFFPHVCRAKDEIMICIGPEGDFTKNEIDLAICKGMDAVSLGNQRLRTETAGVVACTIVNMLADM